MKTINRDVRLVEAAINDSKKLQDFLCNHLKELQYQSGGYKSLLAPIRRLPVEILQEVFVLADAADHERIAGAYQYIPNARTNRPPTTSQINRHWRGVALDTPSLWATSWITLGTKEEKGAAKVETLKLRIERADPVPFSLVIHTTTEHLPLWHQDAYDDGPEDEGDYYSNRRRKEREHEVDELMGEVWVAAELLATKAILPFLRRLGSVIILEYSNALVTFLSELEEHGRQPPLPQLRFLSLPAEIGPQDAPSLPFRWAENLERLSVDSERLIDPDEDPGTWTAIPWRSLSAFHGPISDSELENVFQFTCARLQIATIVVQNIHPRPKLMVTQYSPLQNLTSLHLRAINVPESSDSLPPLPALRHLVFQPDCTESYGRLHLIGTRSEAQQRKGRAIKVLKASILAVVNAWGSRLDYFGLDVTKSRHSDSLNPSFVEEIIAATPNLEALALPSDWMTEISRIAPHLPRLSHIEMLKASHFFYGHGRRQPDPKDMQWSRETLSKLRTLTFCEVRHQSMEGALDKAKRYRLGVVISWQPLEESMRFSSPYFVMKGGLFTKCLADEKVREQVSGRGKPDWY